MYSVHVRALVWVRINPGKNTLDFAGHIKTAGNRRVVGSEEVFQMDGSVALECYVALQPQRPALTICRTTDDAVVGRKSYQHRGELRAFDNFETEFLFNVRHGQRH